MLRAPPGLQALPSARGNGTIHCGLSARLRFRRILIYRRKDCPHAAMFTRFPSVLREKETSTSIGTPRASLLPLFSRFYFLLFSSVPPAKARAFSVYLTFPDETKYPSILEIARVRTRRDAFDKEEGCSAAREGCTSTARGCSGSTRRFVGSAALNDPL